MSPNVKGIGQSWLITFYTIPSRHFARRSPTSAGRVLSSMHGCYQIRKRRHQSTRSIMMQRADHENLEAPHAYRTLDIKPWGKLCMEVKGTNGHIEYDAIEVATAVCEEKANTQNQLASETPTIGVCETGTTLLAPARDIPTSFFRPQGI